MEGLLQRGPSLRGLDCRVVFVRWNPGGAQARFVTDGVWCGAFPPGRLPSVGTLRVLHVCCAWIRFPGRQAFLGSLNHRSWDGETLESIVASPQPSGGWIDPKIVY